MAGYRDTTKASRLIEEGDWTGLSRTVFRFLPPPELVACELTLTPSTLVYRESCSAGAKGVEIGRADLAMTRIELMPGGEEVRLLDARGDLGLRLPHPLGLMALAWWAERPPYAR